LTEEMKQRMAGEALAKDTEQYKNTHADYNGAGSVNGPKPSAADYNYRSGSGGPGQTSSNIDYGSITGSNVANRAPVQLHSHEPGSKPAWDVGSAMELGSKYIKNGRDMAQIDLPALDSRMNSRASAARAQGDITMYNAMGDIWGGVTADWKSPEASQDYDINETRKEVNKHTDKTQTFLSEQIESVWDKAGKMANSV
jgi:hypothetical protein